MHMKSFYALLLHKRYTEIRARDYHDACTYADYMWGTDVLRVYSSGGWYQYKSTHPDVKELWYA